MNRRGFIRRVVSWTGAGMAANRWTEAEEPSLWHLVIDGVDIVLRLPPHSGPFRGTVVFPSDVSIGGTADPWAITERLCGLAHLGMLLQDMDRTRRPVILRNALLRALPLLARESGHPELADAPLFFAGMSRGGGWSAALARDLPERTIGYVNVCGWIQDPKPEALHHVPALFILGGQDDGFHMLRNIPTDYDPARRAGALWTLALQWGLTHHWGNADALALPYLAWAARTRLGDGKTLNPVQEQGGWLGDRASWETRDPRIASWKRHPGSRQAAIWLPDSYLAHVWRALMATDRQLAFTVTDETGTVRLASDARRPSLALSELSPLYLNAVLTDEAHAGRVHFFDGDRRLGVVDRPPWRLLWKPNEPGPHALFGELEDKEGGRSVSAPLLLVAPDEKWTDMAARRRSGSDGSGKSSKPPVDETAFQQRKDTYLDAVRRAVPIRMTFADGVVTFSAPDPGKHLWHHIFALLSANPSPDQRLPGMDLTVQRLVHELVTFPNMFHFNADGPAACLMRFPHAIPPEDRRFLFEGHARSVLNHSEEPNYNLFTGEGTENHVAMSRFAGYLLCQDWLQDHPDDARARQGLADARAYILQHARDVYRAGIGEFNSSTYYGYQMRGIFTCFEFARDNAVRDACRALLDYFATEICLKYMQGVNAGPESRGQAAHSAEKEVDQIVYLWFGDSPTAPTTPTNAVYVALSSYRPPALLAPIARKQPGMRGAYANSHPTYLLDQAAASRESLYFGDGYALGCLYLPAAGYTGATAQFLPAKLVCRSAPSASSAWMLLANSNSRSDDGTGRGPYDQWAHHRDVLVQITHVPEHAARLAETANAITAKWRTDWQESFARRWPGTHDAANHGPRVSTVRTTGILSYLLFPRPTGAETDRMETDPERHIVFVCHDDIYLAIRSLGHALPETEQTSDGRTRLIDPIDDRGTGGFVLEVGTRSEDSSFERFRQRIREKTVCDVARLMTEQIVRYRNRHGAWIEVRYRTIGDQPVIEPVFDWGYVPDPEKDKPAPLMTKPPFVQPVYPTPGDSLSGWGRVPAITVNGKPPGDPRFWDLAAPWPVFQGPHVTLSGGVLTIRWAKAEYRVDFSGDAPRWHQTTIGG